MEDQDTTREVQIGHAIMNQFRFNYKDSWVSDKVLYQKDRTWVKVFNKLIKDGLIKKKKTYAGYQYKWVGGFP